MAYYDLGFFGHCQWLNLGNIFVALFAYFGSGWDNKLFTKIFLGHCQWLNLGSGFLWLCLLILEEEKR